MLRGGFKQGGSYPFDSLGGELPLKVDMWIEINDDCEWKFTNSECMRYGEVPLDSCDCDWENGKHGGWVWNNCLKMRVDPNNDF
jgi:hypothetical protein